MFRADIQVLAAVKHTGSGDLDTSDHDSVLNNVFQLTSGTGDNQAQTSYADEGTISSSASVDLDLLALLPDIITPALAASKLRVLIIQADDANASDIVLSPSPSNGFVGPLGGAAPAHTIHPGGMYAMIEPLGGGWTLDSTHKSLRLANAGSGTLTYSILAIAA